MSVNLALAELAKPVEAGQSWPRPACPRCQIGYVGFAPPVEDEDHASASARSHPAFDPEWVAGTFTIRGQCENPECRQAVHGSSDFHTAYSDKSVDHDGWDDRGDWQWSSYYTVAHVHPPMLIMSIPATAPDEVREGVQRASRVLFADPGLAATALRATVERFLTSQGIPAIDSAGAFRTAHHRIEEWRDADPTLLRQYLKKNGNIAIHDQAALDDFAERLNDRPREVLGWRTPNEVYRQLLTEVPLVPDAIEGQETRYETIVVSGSGAFTG